MAHRILIIDDEPSMIEWLKVALEEKDYEVVATTDPGEGLELLKSEVFDLIISDIRMPKIDGLRLLKRAKKIVPKVPLIFITAYGSLESAIAAIRSGARDYILKPFSINTLYKRIDAALMKEELVEPSTMIVGKSKAIKEILSLIDRIAPTDATVLVTGESGVGKELVAREIHLRSPRAQGPFITVSCGALPETLLESELFGYKKGAFTGAHRDKLGLFKVADSGSFFLDEIGDAPPVIQMKLLRLLQEKEIVPLGDIDPVKVDVRIIAATNKDLQEEVRKGRFREDLYYRLNVVPIHIPPLRERKEDIIPLAEYFLKRYSLRTKSGLKRLSRGAQELLLSYHWPGNVREVENIIERTVILSKGPIIREVEIEVPNETVKTKAKRRTKRRKKGILREIEKKTIEKVLNEEKGDVAKAAKRLGIHRVTLYRMLKRWKER
ncbi:MAG TPA: sigma-54-dependent Fis family transcriptional regulator [bacterium (Candidatus Stahlbacteria)]|nr:sigma-54-dependent Fis family transcriptional regulator [Candidatus Stahlbacteria bacterium]